MEPRIDSETEQLTSLHSAQIIRDVGEQTVQDAIPEVLSIKAVDLRFNTVVGTTAEAGMKSQRA